MKQLRENLQKHPLAVKIIVLGYIVFAGCFVFPFGSERFPFDFTKAYLVAASYGIIALALAGIYGANKEKLVYGISLGLTPVGMVCRYLLEYGEVSNIRNFTPFNIASYIAVIPIYTVIAYHLIVRHLIKETRRESADGLK